MLLDSTGIERQVEKILSSTEFARSGRMARFLRHVISCKLQSRMEDLKERSIGIQVFDRPSDWDPKLDTIVRSEARRLRRKLEQYYDGPSSDHFVHISIPKGGYAPTFQFLAEPSPSLTGAAVAVRLPRFWILGGAFLLLALIFGIAGWAGLRRLGERPSAAAKVPEIIPFANEIGTEINPSISPDGKTIAYVWDGNGENYDIYLKPSDQGAGDTPRRLTDSAEPDLYPAWSPDGKALAFVRIQKSDAVVIVKDLATGLEKAITHVPHRPSGWVGDYSPNADVGPSWLPNGKSVVISEAAADEEKHAIYRIDLPKPDRQLIIQTNREVADYFPRVSPDGRLLAFVRYISHGVSDLYLCSIDGSNLRRLTFDRRGITGLAWDPDGRSLFYAAWRQGTPRIWEISTATGSQPEALPDAVAAADLSVGPGGKWLAYAAISENWNIWRIPLRESPNGSWLGTPQRFIASSGRNHGPSFSPDRKQLAFISDRTGSWQIWLCDPDGKHLRQLTKFDGGFLGSVNWTPDSRKIAFDARPAGNSNIYTLDVEQGDTPKALDANRFEERMPAWSADGKAVFFNSNRDGDVAVWRKSLIDGSAKRVGLNGSFKSQESATGDCLFFNIKGGLLYRANPDGSVPQQLTGVEATPEINWITDGQNVFYTQQEQTGQVGFFQFVSGKPRLILQTPGQLVRSTSNLAVSPDKRWLLYAQQDHFTSDIVVRRFAGR